jgi:hypothetical protein
VITQSGLDDSDGVLEFGTALPCFIMLQAAMGIAIAWCIIIARQQGSSEKLDAAEAASAADTRT